MTKEQKISVAVAMITCFVAPFMSSGLNLSVTYISDEFNSPAGLSTWIVNAYTLSTAAFSVCMGSLADLRGRRTMILIGCIAFALSSALCALSLNIYMLIACRFLMGVTGAIILSSNIPLMLLYFPPQVKGRMLGITVSAVYVGLALGPTLGGFINDTVGWRAILGFGIVLSMAAFFLCTKLEPPAADNKEAGSSPSFDHRGNILYIMSIMALMFGLTNFTEKLWGPVAVIAGIALLVVFVLVEWRTEHPMMHVKLFKTSRAYGFSNLATLLNFAAIFAVSYTMAIYLQNVKDMDASVAGLVLIVQPIAQIVLGPISGRLSDRFPSSIIASIGIVFCTISLGMLITLNIDTPLWYIAIALVLMGIGLGSFSAPNNNAVLSCVDHSHYSEASAMISTMRGIGQSASLAFASMMLSSNLGATIFSKSEDVLLTSTISQIMLVCFIISLLSLAASLVRSGK